MVKNPDVLRFFLIVGFGSPHALMLERTLALSKAKNRIDFNKLIY